MGEAPKMGLGRKRNERVILGARDKGEVRPNSLSFYNAKEHLERENWKRFY